MEYIGINTKGKLLPTLLMGILRPCDIFFWDKYMDTPCKVPASGSKWPPATGTAHEHKCSQDQKEIQQENWINEGEAFDLINVFRTFYRP